jgi:O-antigen/teichoic acid export membrane protein
MKRTPIVKEVGTLLTGNVVAQLVALAAYFVLTRIFSPEDYGLYNIFYSYIEVLIIASTCKYELAIVCADNDGEAAAVMRLSLRLNTIVSVVLLSVALLLWLTDSLPGNFAQLGWMVLLIPPMVFFCGTSRVYTFIFNRMRNYAPIALSDMVNAVSGICIKIGLGLLGFLQSGMPIGTVAGRAVANMIYRLKLKRCRIWNDKSVERIPLRTVARKYGNFPLFVATKDFLNSFSNNLPFLWLAAFFSQTEVGLFALALTFTFRPVNLLNNAIEKVYYACTSESVHKGEPIGRLIRRLLLVVNVVAVPVCVLAWFVAEPVFAFCFGGRWAGCGIYVQALLPWVLVMLSSTSLMFVSNVFSTQRTEFCFYVVLLVLRIVALAVGLYSGSFLLAIRLFAAAGALVSASLLVWYLWQVQRYDVSLRR